MEVLQDTEQDVLPKFPELTGPLGRLVEAISPDIPYEHKALTALTYMGLALSGRTKLAHYADLQPRFYACLVGPKSTGKSTAQEKVSAALKGLGKVLVEPSINSEQGLLMTFKDHSEKASRLLYLPNRLAGAFQKARRGTMFDAFDGLYERNVIGYRVKKDTIKITNAHLAIVATATPEDFGTLWQNTGGDENGFQSRFVLSFSNANLPRMMVFDSDQKAIDEAVKELTEVLSSPPLEITLPEEHGRFTFGLLGEEDESRFLDFILENKPTADEKQFPRAVNMGRRFALIVAACNRKTQIDDETMKLAAAFIKYQVAAYKLLMPADVSNAVQQMEGRILGFFAKQPAVARSKRDIQNFITPKTLPDFGRFNKALDNLVKAERLKEVGKNRSGFSQFKLMTEPASESG